MEDSFRVTVAVGTYEGVLAGWELDREPNEEGKKINKFQIAFASPIHTGSIRCVAHQEKAQSNAILSCGYDETMKTHDFVKRQTGTGEIRTPSEYGTPCCASFAQNHCLVAFSEGPVVIYKKRDWSVQHVFKGHEGGVSTIAAHPSGKLALSGGSRDGKLKLWDLTKGRLAYATKVDTKGQIDSLVWNKEGTCYGFSYGSRVTVRDVSSGADLLDITLPARINQICLMEGKEGTFVVAACNDGSLPVLDVPTSPTASAERYAVMAIEPVEGPVAGTERFKCVQAVHGYYIVTANSSGVLNLVSLAGAVRMIQQDKNASQETSERETENEGSEGEGSESDDDEEQEFAAEIIDSTQLGSGARITCLVAYATPSSEVEVQDENEKDGASKEPNKRRRDNGSNKDSKSNHSKQRRVSEVLGDDELKKARELVSKAKKIQQKKKKKREKNKSR